MDVGAVLSWLAKTPDDKRVEDKARLLLLDTLACAASGFGAPEVDALAGELERISPGPVQLPGSGARLASLDAVYVLTVAACWHEACEGLASAHGRPGLHAIPPALVLGLQAKKSLRQIIRAIVTGYEIGGRLGEKLRIRDGMHVDGTWGSLAAAAASAALLSDRPSIIETAVRIAACQVPASLYLPVPQGSTARNTYAGHGAVLGVQSALAALAGLSGPDGAVTEADRLVFANNQSALAFTPRFLILDAYIKPFAAVRHVHYGAACALEWKEENPDTDLSAIDAIALDTYGEAVTYCGNRAPKSPLEAQFSLSYGAAHALVHGSLDPDAYTPSALADRDTMRLERLMDVRVDPSIQHRGAALTVTAKGRRSVVAVDEILGDVSRPMTATEVTAKARRYLESRLSPAEAAALLEAVLSGDLDAPWRLSAATR